MVEKCNICRAEIKENERRFYIMHAEIETYRDSWDTILIICPRCFFSGETTKNIMSRKTEADKN